MSHDVQPPDPIRAARDEVARGDVRPATTLPAGERAGDVIDRYKLLERIGEGGMGTVWMAEQREPVKRRVALKIIKLGMDTKQVIARFEAERQALALMDHPHIAKVLDAGATETGRPYFVMEYIKGIPILEYCDQEKIDTRARLELFAKVCHAIQHAHQKGIIHRDIKPSNVLVTLHDGVPVPKVIDFGIAKATNSELTTKTLFTEHRQMVGTPAYMSPEQAEMSGLDIDTRADIYSLGVLLYELLTGTTPLDMRKLLSKGFAEMMRAIREDEPHKPSTRVSSFGDTGTRTALLRKVDASKLSSLLRGDLDWIVMKCLEKDRNRRYETANGLAADIRRHLNDEPVTAGAPSAGYKLRKFVRRNRGQVLAAGAVVAALLCGVVAFAWQATEARDQRDRAVAAQRAEAEQRQLAEAAKLEAQTQEARATEQEAEARRQEAQAKEQEAEAKKQAAIAEAVAKFQTDMLAAVDPSQLPKDPQTGEPLKDAVTVVQAMAAAVKVLDEGTLAEQPLVEARVRNAIGNTLRALGRYDEAEPNIKKALALHRAALPPGHLSIASSLHNFSVLLIDQHKLAEAEPLARESLEIHRAVFPAGHAMIAASVHNLAGLLSDQNKRAEAEQLYREALAMRRAALPAGHEDIAVNLNNLARLLQSQNEIEEAESLYREALASRRAAYPAGHPAIAQSLCILATLLVQCHRLAEAEPMLREGLNIWRATLPDDHPTIAEGLSDFAMLLYTQGKFEEAEPLFREMLRIRRAALPADHPHIATALNNLASVRMDQGALAEAESHFREALRIVRASFSSGHPEIALGLNNLGHCLMRQGKFAEAEPLVREALEIWRADLPAEHPDIAVSLGNLTQILLAQDKLAEAEPLGVEALAIRRASLPPGHPSIAIGLNDLGLLLQARNRLAEAEPLLVEALEINRAAHHADHPNVFAAKRNLADLYDRQGRIDRALPLFRELLESFRATRSEDSVGLAGLLARICQALVQRKAWDEAEPLLRECLAIREKSQPEEWTTFNTRSTLGGVLLYQSKLEQAEPLLLAGYQGLKERESAMPPDVRALRLRDALERLVKLYEAKGNETEAAAWRSKLEAVPAASHQDSGRK